MSLFVLINSKQNTCIPNSVVNCGSRKIATIDVIWQHFDPSNESQNNSGLLELCYAKGYILSSLFNSVVVNLVSSLLGIKCQSLRKIYHVNIWKMVRHKNTFLYDSSVIVLAKEDDSIRGASWFFGKGTKA
jgi:hypothetical protein